MLLGILAVLFAAVFFRELKLLLVILLLVLVWNFPTAQAGPVVDKELEQCAGIAAMASTVASVRNNQLPAQAAMQIATGQFGSGSKWNFPEEGIQGVVDIIYSSGYESPSQVKESVFNECYKPANR